MRSRPEIGIALSLGLFFLCLYLLSGSSDLLHNGDTDLRYQTAQAIVDHHRLWIADPMWRDIRLARGLGGHLYAFYAPGQPALMVPLYLAGKAIAHHLALPYDVTTLYACRSIDLWLGALLAVLFFLMASSVGYSARTAALLTLIFGVATVAWPDAQTALEQTQVNLFLLAAVFGAWNFVRSGRRERGWLLLAGSSIGLAFFTRYDAALYAPVVGLYIVLTGRNGRPLRGAVQEAAVYALAAAPWIALVALWNLGRFGSVWKTGLQEATLGEPFWKGFLGLTVSPGKGLLWYLPLVFLLPWAAPRFRRWRPSLSLLFAALVLLPLLFYSNVLYWHGDPAWGPRYLYTAVPYLLLPLGTLLTGWSGESRSLRAFFVLLVSLSVVINLSAVSVTQWRFWYHLEAMEQRTSQPFQWGAAHYHYYWNVAQSPILIQVKDVYEVSRLYLGDQRYRLTKHPGPPTVSNPADRYPVNAYAFWWADPLHPLLGVRARALIALSLAAAGLLALALLWVQLAASKGGRPEVRELELAQAVR